MTICMILNKNESVNNLTSFTSRTSHSRRKTEKISQKFLSIIKCHSCNFMYFFHSFGVTHTLMEFSLTLSIDYEAIFGTTRTFTSFLTKAQQVFQNFSWVGEKISMELAMAILCFTSFQHWKQFQSFLVQCHQKKTKNWQDWLQNYGSTLLRLGKDKKSPFFMAIWRIPFLTAIQPPNGLPHQSFLCGCL